MSQRLRLRHAVTRAMRSYLDEHGFVDIETPMLTKATPEGARDYLVPSRTHAGQVLRAAAVAADLQAAADDVGLRSLLSDRASCFRDEDLRADRQPEFTQLDIETSFLTQDEIMATDGSADAAFLQGRAWA